MIRRTLSAGFTLIEVLLAIAITAVVMLTVGTTFTAMLEAREVIDNIGESTEAGTRILNLIERDLRGLWTYNIKGNAVLRGRFMDVGSFEADRIDLLTTTDAVGSVLDSYSRQVRPSICEVGYWLRQNPRYRDLIELWRREDPMVDDDLLTQGSFQLIYDRLKNFKISYYRTLGYESEELHEWDSSVDDELPRRIKIEFTLERRRGNRNQVTDSEVRDFEGAEKTYVRHIVLDRRYTDILKAGVAMIPLLPPPPADDKGGGPAGPGGKGDGKGGPGGKGGAAAIGGKIDINVGATPGRGDKGRGMPNGGEAGNRRGNGNQGPPPPRGGGPPGNGFDLGNLLRGGANGGGNLFGGGRR